MEFCQDERKKLSQWRNSDNVKGGFSLKRAFCQPYACKQTTALTKRANHILAKCGKEMVRRPSPTTKQKRHPYGCLFRGGGWWIRTTEVSDNRFTVCPLWPLGKSPILWSWRTESNHQPADYKSAALPLSHASMLSCNGDILSYKN